MPNTTVPAPGEAVPATYDPFLDTITAYRKAKQQFADIPDEIFNRDNEDAFIAATYGPLQSALFAWEAGAQSREGAIEALKLMTEEDVFGDSMGIAMHRVVLGYLESLDAQDPWIASRALMKELSHVLSRCNGGECAAHILPMEGERFDRFIRFFPRADEGDAETPVDRVERLAVELSEALSEYAGGSFQAMVQPSSLAGHQIVFVKVGAWVGRAAR